MGVPVAAPERVEPFALEVLGDDGESLVSGLTFRHIAGFDFDFLGLKAQGPGQQQGNRHKPFHPDLLPGVTLHLNLQMDWHFIE
jgi:hypothetical protein